jgi:hypothetical protein
VWRVSLFPQYINYRLAYFEIEGAPRVLVIKKFEVVASCEIGISLETPDKY